MPLTDTLVCKHFQSDQAEQIHIPLQKLNAKLFSTLSDSIYVLRLDKIKHKVSGNKLFKLLPNLHHAQQNNLSQIISFAGSHSNHLDALAKLTEKTITCTAIIRGERPSSLSATLQYAQAKGVHLHFVSRTDYQRLQHEKHNADLQQLFGTAHIVPVGGSNLLGLQGLSLLGRDFFTQYFDTFEKIIMACGTGGSLAGFTAGLEACGQQSNKNAHLKQLNKNQIIGINVVNNLLLANEVNHFLNQLRTTSQDWQINNNYHFGAYAKFNNALLEFIAQLENELGEVVDHVYMGKVFYAVYDQLQKGLLTPNEKILIMHTGGQQGAINR